MAPGNCVHIYASGLVDVGECYKGFVNDFEVLKVRGTRYKTDGATEKYDY
jgi:hypothetical protein